MNQIPRRARLDLSAPAEVAIRNAMAAVEKLDADERLTNALTKLDDAMDLVADYIDEQINATRELNASSVAASAKQDELIWNNA